MRKTRAFSDNFNERLAGNGRIPRFFETLIHLEFPTARDILVRQEDLTEVQRLPVEKRAWQLRRVVQ